MDVLFTKEAWDDYQYWFSTDKNILKKINQLIKECLRVPYEGLGKPEPLKFHMAGYWSRRINHEHRLVYKIQEDHLILLQCRYHY
tara:strand:+ start:162 stop:416 length:255 start_codon:yes stop_codon:yes gene_type:complete